MNSLNPVAPQARFIKRIFHSEAHIQCNIIRVCYALGSDMKTNIFNTMNKNKVNEWNMAATVYEEIKDKHK